MTDISKRAQKTLELIKNGKFYMAYDENLPATIQELLDAKLIVGTVRATTYVASFAPAEGYVPMRMEQFARGQCGDGEGYAVALVEIAAPDLLAALKMMTDKYVELANSGDCGFWDVSKDEDVIKARAVLAKVGVE